jgi:hypothetical protein
MASTLHDECANKRKSNIKHERNSKINHLLVFLMVQTLAPERAAQGTKCLNQNTSETMGQ